MFRVLPTQTFSQPIRLQTVRLYKMSLFVYLPSLERGDLVPLSDPFLVGFFSDLSTFASCWLSPWGCKKQRPTHFLPVALSSTVASLVTICPNTQMRGASSCNDMRFATGWIKVSDRIQLHHFLCLQVDTFASHSSSVLCRQG